MQLLTLRNQEFVIYDLLLNKKHIPVPQNRWRREETDEREMTVVWKPPQSFGSTISKMGTNALKSLSGLMLIKLACDVYIDIITNYIIIVTTYIIDNYYKLL